MKELLMSEVDEQRQKIATEYKLLLENPTVENMYAYQVLIKDFVSAATMQLYATEKNMPQRNFYAKVSEMDAILQEIGEAVKQGDRQNLIKQCERLSELLDNLFWYS